MREWALWKAEDHVISKLNMETLAWFSGFIYMFLRGYGPTWHIQNNNLDGILFGKEKSNMNLAQR
jgi:hypothetical protein